MHFFQHYLAHLAINIGNLVLPIAYEFIYATVDSDYSRRP